MSEPPLPADAQELLRRPNPAVVATLRRDGAPVSAPTWYLWEDDRALVNMDEGRVRLQHLRRDPRVTLSVLDRDSWYTHLTLLGRVTEIREDEGLRDINRMAQHYLGREYPNQERTRFTAVVEVERWHGWGSMKDNDQSG